MFGGDPRFFLGTDSAPHTDGNKLLPCGCAGVYCAPNTLSCVTEVFDVASRLKQLEAFVTLNAARFYGLTPSTATLTLTKGEALPQPAPRNTAAGPVTVFDPGFPLHWHITG